MRNWCRSAGLWRGESGRDVRAPSHSLEIEAWADWKERANLACRLAEPPVMTRRLLSSEPDGRSSARSAGPDNVLLDS
jgi:hypothetical protein